MPGLLQLHIGSRTAPGVMMVNVFIQTLQGKAHKAQVNDVALSGQQLRLHCNHDCNKMTPGRKLPTKVAAMETRLIRKEIIVWRACFDEVPYGLSCPSPSFSSFGRLSGVTFRWAVWALFGLKRERRQCDACPPPFGCQAPCEPICGQTVDQNMCCRPSPGCNGPWHSPQEEYSCAEVASFNRVCREWTANQT